MDIITNITDFMAAMIFNLSGEINTGKILSSLSLPFFHTLVITIVLIIGVIFAWYIISFGFAYFLNTRNKHSEYVRTHKYPVLFVIVGVIVAIFNISFLKLLFINGSEKFTYLPITYSTYISDKNDSDEEEERKALKLLGMQKNAFDTNSIFELKKKNINYNDNTYDIYSRVFIPSSDRLQKINTKGKVGYCKFLEDGSKNCKLYDYKVITNEDNDTNYIFSIPELSIVVDGLIKDRINQTYQINRDIIENIIESIGDGDIYFYVDKENGKEENEVIIRIDKNVLFSPGFIDKEYIALRGENEKQSFIDTIKKTNNALDNLEVKGNTLTKAFLSWLLQDTNRIGDRNSNWTWNRISGLDSGYYNSLAISREGQGIIGFYQGVYNSLSNFDILGEEKLLSKIDLSSFSNNNDSLGTFKSIIISLLYFIFSIGLFFTTLIIVLINLNLFIGVYSKGKEIANTSSNSKMGMYVKTLQDYSNSKYINIPLFLGFFSLVYINISSGVLGEMILSLVGGGGELVNSVYFSIILLNTIISFVGAGILFIVYKKYLKNFLIEGISRFIGIYN